MTLRTENTTIKRGIIAMTDREIFQHNLNYYLSRSGKKQKDLADYVGAKTTTVSGWTRGISYPRAEAMEKIAMFFGIPTSQLISITDMNHAYKKNMPPKFGDRMKEYRKKKNMTLDDLAVNVNSSKQVLSRYERSERVPKISAAKEIADALDVPLEFLIGYEYNEHDSGFNLRHSVPQTIEACIIAKGIDSMPKQQREAVLGLMRSLYPGMFDKEPEDE